MRRTYSNIYHIIFLLIITTHYSLSFLLFDGIIFGQETDVFEHEILFNRILDSIIKSIDLFMSLIDTQGHLCLPFPKLEIFIYLDIFDIALK